MTHSHPSATPARHPTTTAIYIYKWILWHHRRDTKIPLYSKSNAVEKRVYPGKQKDKNSFSALTTVFRAFIILLGASWALTLIVYWRETALNHRREIRGLGNSKSKHTPTQPVSHFFVHNSLTLHPSVLPSPHTIAFVLRAPIYHSVKVERDIIMGCRAGDRRQG